MGLIPLQIAGTIAVLHLRVDISHSRLRPGVIACFIVLALLAGSMGMVRKAPKHTRCKVVARD